MKETPVSNVEKSFIYEAISKAKRTDGRHLDERRNVEIHFGHEFGSCIVSLGQTRASAQVSCSIMEPRATRPNEGMLFIYVEFLPMCSQRFMNKAYGGAEEEVNEVTRLLERCIKESKAVDTESLCIVAEEKVWGIRLDIRILNHEGNVADCASIAGLAALAHFRRPDVSLDGNKVTIHPLSERDPIKLSIHHYPVCTTYAFFTEPENPENKIIIKDPSSIEESVMDGKIVLGMNPYREICTLHLAGKMLINKGIVLKLTTSAAENSKVAVDVIKKALEKDETARKTGQDLGLIHSMKRDSILNNERQPQEIDIDKLTDRNVVKMEEEDAKEETEINEPQIEDQGDGVVEMQVPESSDGEEEEDTDDVIAVEEVKAEDKKKVVAEIDLHESSEEEEMQTLSGKDLQQTNSEQGRKWYKQNWK